VKNTKDPRLEKLAKILVHHSTRLQKGENVLIEAFDLTDLTLVKLLINEAKTVGANPVVDLKKQEILRELCLCGSDEVFNLIADIEAYRMKKMQAYIGIRSWLNTSEFADVSSEINNRYELLCRKPVHLDVRVPSTKWVVLRYPNYSMAQQAGMSTEAFENFYFDVCTIDYARMEKAMKPLKKLMKRTDRVRIIGPDTDLFFSIKGIPTVPCFGLRNIPDGEIYTAPVRESVNGHIAFNTPSLENGRVFQGIRLEFENGKIVRATAADQTNELNKILDTDEGARYIGEFSFGLNPFVLKPMKDTLFDEKISGSFHFTPGSSYKEADNGNKSAVHWDLVSIQRPEYGGGQIYFDDVWIRRDGLFLPEELQGLNPENLK
jgi:aminopeptidase